MSRKQAICYLIIGIIVLLTVLFVLTMINVWIMLLFLLLLVLGSGLAYDRYPDLFVPLCRRTNQTPSAMPGVVHDRAQTLGPTMVLVSLNAGSQEQIVVNHDNFTIGRGETCDYVLRDAPSVSRRHVTIRVDRDNREAAIIDNQSQNGTFVNNSRLMPETPVALFSGDVIQIGELRFSVQFAQL